MGVRVSELPVTSNVAVDDKLMVLDVSDGVLKTTEVDNVGGGKELTQAQYDALTPEEQASGLYYITDAGGADSAGHTIQDSTTTFTSRANLKFANGVVSDDSTNDATVVNMPFVGTTAEVNAAISGGQLEEGQEVIITDDSASADANQNLASIEDGTTASKAYAVGDFIVHNGLLYKVTAAISSGGTLTPGTNISQTTAGQELSDINSDLAVNNTQITSSDWLSSNYDLALSDSRRYIIENEYMVQIFFIVIPTSPTTSWVKVLDAPVPNSSLVWSICPPGVFNTTTDTLDTKIENDGLYLRYGKAHVPYHLNITYFKQ